ncbi:aminopeptidase N [Thiohalobacter thiocyanaticus]|uniref:Aminopeptidase N n=1 Tax=Thiohalobacter thiocyanaticus TaxID=585455 RepID=A0A426QDW9_9GAMM|nr:aminopeptidase N [Thiohalobacter thiocyanaticus]RRQ19965.1 aminopeptidase N [Thiohalobacter thiocyanaticus]
MDRKADTPKPVTVYLKDYQPPAWHIEAVELDFDLDPDATRVRSRLHFRRAQETAPGTPLHLDGEALELLGISLDGEPLAADRYRLDEAGLEVRDLPETGLLEIETRIQPAANTELSGLYTSSGNFCTQCEAEGFRRITFYPDRPDVMACFTTTLRADKSACPVLLSNGNPVASGELEDGRHYVTWQDPFPKPCYLFALVAGDLGWIEDRFVTRSGREVDLYIYVQKHNLDKCDHAMASLKRAMKWDEAVYGREYDLDRYMIVAVDDFNMGAMENKGLNIFNSRYVLARPDTATDSDYQNIEGVIGHEYFHNWSGNRVTCRDWFQLSLKEGFTVFRDQEFSADMNSRGVQRITDVNILRTHQFREDAGPMAHPVKPDHYVAIDNFYTVTVYNKGAEVVRMLHTLLGPEAFRRGCDRYFERHDGQAVTTDDFVNALEAANGVSLRQFRCWYDQAGTPELTVERHYDPQACTFALTLRQQCPATPGQSAKQPFHIPVAMGLRDGEGRALPLRLYGEAQAVGESRVLELCQEEETFVFQDIAAEPVPVLLRGFSAPVKLNLDYRDAELALLSAHEDDPFCRWEAGQTLARRLLLTHPPEALTGELIQPLVEACRHTLDDAALDPALRALALTLPGEGYLAEFVDTIEPQQLHGAREALRRALAQALRPEWEACYQALTETGPYSPDAAAAGRRRLRNLCLNYLIACEDEAAYELALGQYRSATNMTDSLAALQALVNSDCPQREAVLEDFYSRWQADTLVVDKWLSLQATAARPDTLDRVQALTGHPAFSLANPNKVYSLLRAFAQGNPVGFHNESGAGYRFIGEQIRTLDARNPQVAARLAAAFTDWRRYNPARQAGMREQLQTMRDAPGVSRDLYEIAERSLGEECTE